MAEKFSWQTLFSPKLALDLGSYATKIYDPLSDNVIYEGVTAVAISDEPTGVATEVGQAALKFAFSASVKSIHPVQSSLIQDFESLVVYLKHLFTKTKQGLHFRAPTIGVCLPNFVSDIQASAYADAVKTAGYSKVILVSSIHCAQAYLDLNSGVLINAGHGNLEIGVILEGMLVKYEVTNQVSGVQANQAIMSYFKNKYNLQISNETAQNLKHKLTTSLQKEKTTVFGKDNIMGIPREVEVTYREIYESLQPLRLELTSKIRSVLSSLSPEIIEQLAVFGIYIYGGMAHIWEMDDAWSTGMNITIEKEPELVVVKGLGRIISNKKLIEQLEYKQKI